MFLLDACHGDLIWCVLEGFIPFLRGCLHIASISRSAPGRCESECFQGSRACPIPMTPILFPATMLLAEHATRIPCQSIEQNCVARVGKADGHGQKGQKMNQIVRKKVGPPFHKQISPTKLMGFVQRHTANTRGTLGAKSAPQQKYQLTNSTHEGEGTRRTREGHCKVHLTKKGSVRTTSPYASKIVSTLVTVQVF